MEIFVFGYCESCGNCIEYRALSKLAFVVVDHYYGNENIALGFCSKKCAKEYVRKEGSK